MNLLATILIVFFVVVGLTWLGPRVYGFIILERMQRQVFPIWASLGPFKNGRESALAFQASFQSFYGLEETVLAEMSGLFEKHRMAYEANTVMWEGLRIDYTAQSVNEGTRNLAQELFQNSL